MAELLGYQFERVYAGAIERYRQVATIAERDAIPTGIRYEGLKCYVTGEDEDYQLRGGLTNIDWLVPGGANWFDTANDDSDDITEGLTNLFLTTIERGKLGFITITQAVDLDQLETDVAALGSGVVFKGTWSPSGGVFPGGGVTAIGDLYIADDGGTIDSVTFSSGDGVIATVVNASTTIFAANWAKTESVSDVTSVVGLTGVISKSALLSALNVEDGATADMTGTEISSAITTFLTSADWQTKLTNEEVLDFVGAAINAGTQTKITVEYDDPGGVFNFTVDPFMVVYATLAALVAAQGSQADDKFYEVTDASGFTDVTSGRAWVRYKGTTTGDETDYIIISKEESVSQTAPIPLTYADDTALFAGQGNQTLNFIYEVTDGSGFTGVTSGAIWVKYLGTTTPDETDYIIVSKAVVAGAGDMVLADAQTNTGIKTFFDTTMKLRNVANTFDGYFVNTNTADRIYTLPNVAGTVVLMAATQTLTNKTLTTPLGIVPSDILDRLEEDATVTGTKNIDWTAYETFKYVLTGACTFSDTNLPSTGSKVITIHITGNFAPTYPAGWTTNIRGTYDGTVTNMIVVEYVKSGTPFYVVDISQPD